jgi:hypothetical protein
VREHEVGWGHLVEIAMDYADGRMTPPEGFVAGGESATPHNAVPSASAAGAR